jgi:hypothetical protein
MTKFLITALAAGALMGLGFAGTDLFNPHTAAAEANRMNIDAQHQQTMYQLDEQLAAAKTEAEIKEIQRQQVLLDAQYAHDIQALNQDLAHRDVAFKTWMTILAFLGGALSIAIILGTFLWTGSKVLASISFDPTPTSKYIPPVEKKIVNLPEREPYDPWSEPDYRRQKRVAAQQEERREREELQALAARMKTLSDSVQMSAEEYNKPRW